LRTFAPSDIGIIDDKGCLANAENLFPNSTITQ